MDTDDAVVRIDPLPRPNPEYTLEAVESRSQEINKELDVLCRLLHRPGQNRGVGWLKEIMAVKLKDGRTLHVIGIMGITGAGKSTLINTILCVRGLVPTSCLKACTAVPIEISHNYSQEHPYTAIIEFISEESWQKEIRTLLRHTSNADTADLNEADSEAAVAIAKLSAVYPDMSRERLLTLTELDINEFPALDVLGTSITLNASSDQALGAKIKQYVASGCRSQISVDGNEGTESSTVQSGESWPLIQRVRLFAKADVLNTGCMLVDLPGGSDDNDAREAIAGDYLAKCDSVWIVAPVVRAIDEKNGQRILNDGLKQQLRRDGKLGRITFLLSKTDDCIVDDMKAQFMSDPTFFADMLRVEKMRETVATGTPLAIREIEKATKNFDAASNGVTMLDAKVDIYVKLLNTARAGETVHPPIFTSDELTHTAQKPFSSQQRNLDASKRSSLVKQYDDTPMDDLLSSDDDDEGETDTLNADDIEQDRTAPAMSVEDIMSVIGDHQENLRTMHKQLKACRSRVSSAKKKLKRLKAMENSAAKEEWKICHKARDTFVKTQLQMDFKAGIQELEQEATKGRDDRRPTLEKPANMKPQTDLPIFGIASHSFQRLLTGPIHKTVSKSFMDAEMTGIPAVMQLCIDAGEEATRSARRPSINQVAQILTSLSIWINNTGTTSVFDSEKAHEMIKQFTQDAGAIMEDFIAVIDSEVASLVKTFDTAARTAEGRAMGTVSGWGVPRKANKTGLNGKTYQAILRYGGINTKPGKERDFVAELLDPMMLAIDGDWYEAFHQAIPTAATESRARYHTLIQDFHFSLVDGCKSLVAGPGIRDMLKQQFDRLEKALGYMIDKACSLTHDKQAKANRIFKAACKDTLSPLFVEASKQSGKGMLDRIKQEVHNIINGVKGTVFHDAGRRVEGKLDKYRIKVRKVMAADLKRCFEAIERDIQNLSTKQRDECAQFTTAQREELLSTIARIEDLLKVEADPVPAEGNPEIKREETSMESASIEHESDPRSISNMSSTRRPDRDDHDNNMGTVGAPNPYKKLRLTMKPRTVNESTQSPSNTRQSQNPSPTKRITLMYRSQQPPSQS